MKMMLQSRFDGLRRLQIRRYEKRQNKIGRRR
jgi:hypothetical protein